MIRYFAILGLLVLVGCAGRGQGLQPMKNTSWETNASYQQIAAVVKGQKAYQDLPPDVQTVYIERQAQIEIVKMLLDSKRIEPDQVMQYLMASPKEITKSIEHDPNLTAEAKKETIASIQETERTYSLEVPSPIVGVYVFLQPQGEVSTSNPAKRIALVDRETFIRDFPSYMGEAKRQGTRLVVTAHDAGEQRWYHTQIKYRGKYLRPVEYNDGSQNHPGAEVPLQ